MKTNIVPDAKYLIINAFDGLKRLALEGQFSPLFVVGLAGLRKINESVVRRQRRARRVTSLNVSVMARTSIGASGTR